MPLYSNGRGITKPLQPHRGCPGSHIAISVLQIIAVSILCLFDISPALNSEGNPIDVIPTFTAASITS